MARLTTCPLCNEKFDRDEVEGIQVGSRWWHLECYKIKEAERLEIEQLKSYIGELFNYNVNWGLINKQIKQYLDKGYKPSGIQGTLHYCYSIQKMNFTKAHGIGIVEFYYKTAGQYFQAMGRMGKEQKVENTIREVVISEPVSTKMTRLKPIPLEDIIDE
jgi:hypothetical protein